MLANRIGPNAIGPRLVIVELFNYDILAGIAQRVTGKDIVN